MGTTFDYSAISPSDAADLREIAAEVRDLVKRMTPMLIEIGERLTSAKAKLPHGTFAAFCWDEAHVRPRRAQLCMRLARFARSHSQTDAFAARTGYMLAKTTTPPQVIAEVMTEACAGRAPSHDNVKSRIAAAKSGAPASSVLDVDKLAARLLDALDEDDVRNVILLVGKGTKAVTSLFCERLRAGLQQRPKPDASEVSSQSPR
jgi:hypothetical protein